MGTCCPRKGSLKPHRVAISLNKKILKFHNLNAKSVIIRTSVFADSPSAAYHSVAGATSQKKESGL